MSSTGETPQPQEESSAKDATIQDDEGTWYAYQPAPQVTAASEDVATDGTTDALLDAWDDMTEEE